MKALFAVLAFSLAAPGVTLRADPAPAAASPVSQPATTPSLQQSAISNQQSPSPAPNSAFLTPNSALPSSPSIPSSPSVPSSSDPLPGQPESAVYAALGQPIGHIILPDHIYLLFNRGEVILRNGIVSEVKLISQAEYAARAAQAAALQAKRLADSARLAAMRKEFLSDPRYQSLSTRDRLLALQSFDQNNPGSDIGQDYDSLLAVYQAELAAQSQLADLEKRLTDAEQQAADAEQQAANAEQQAAAAEQQASNPVSTPAPSGQPITYYAPVAASPVTFYGRHGLAIGGASSGNGTYITPSGNNGALVPR
jgi:hypothetical protein